MEDAERLLSKGAEKYYTKNFEEAVKYCDKTIKMDPKCAPAYVMMASSLDRLGKYEDALACIRGIKMEDLGNMAAWGFYEKALIYSDLKKPDEAIACLDRMLEMDPNDLKAWGLKGAVIQRRWTEGDPAERLEDAIYCYDKAIRLKPDYADTIYNKGVALSLLGRHKEAIVCFDEVVGIDPKHFQAFGSKGSTLDDMAMHEEAIACCDEAIRLKPDYVSTICNKALALHSLGRIQESIDCMIRALKLEPNTEDYAGMRRQLQDMLDSKP